jgi:hypothetical protein
LPSQQFFCSKNAIILPGSQKIGEQRYGSQPRGTKKAIAPEGNTPLGLAQNSGGRHGGAHRACEFRATMFIKVINLGEIGKIINITIGTHHHPTRAAYVPQANTAR